MVSSYMSMTPEEQRIVDDARNDRLDRMPYWLCFLAWSNLGIAAAVVLLGHRFGAFTALALLAHAPAIWLHFQYDWTVADALLGPASMTLGFVFNLLLVQLSATFAHWISTGIAVLCSLMAFCEVIEL